MEKDTVILYYPRVDFKPYYPCFWAPLSILSVAAPLVAKGLNVILLDGNLGDDESDLRTIRNNIQRCICIGISSMIGGNQLERGLQLASFVKFQKVDIPVVFGGPLASVISSELFKSPLVDYVIIGQGENPMSELVDSIRDKKTKDIPGVMVKGECKREIPPLLDKNIFPPYPWNLLNVERYVRNDQYLGSRALNYVSSQGCPYRCGYCSEVASFGCKWKSLTAERTLNETLSLVRDYNLNGIKFYDSNFFVSPNRVIDFSKGLIDSQAGIKWSASAHPKGVIKLVDCFSTIKKSGLVRLLIGAESGSQDSLDYIKKGCRVEDTMLAAEICAKHGISSAFTFIVGIPGIDDDIEATLKMVLEMKKISGNFDIKVHFYAPFPGTPLYEEAKKLGYVPPASLHEWSGYDYYLIQTPWLNKKEESKVRRFGDFYCDFLYPPKWFVEEMMSKSVSRVVYRVLRKLVDLRCKIHFYNLPFEKAWFKMVTKKEIF